MIRGMVPLVSSSGVTTTWRTTVRLSIKWVTTKTTTTTKTVKSSSLSRISALPSSSSSLSNQCLTLPGILRTNHRAVAVATWPTTTSSAVLTNTMPTTKFRYFHSTFHTYSHPTGMMRSASCCLAVVPPNLSSNRTCRGTTHTPSMISMMQQQQQHYPLAPFSSSLGSIRALSRIPSGGGGGGRNPWSWQRAGAVLGTGALVMWGKAKYVLAALKFTKLASLGSMVVSMGAYSMIFGWPYAVGMVSLIAVHEGGHAYVMHRLGIPFSPAVFIPFMGAAIVMQSQPQDAWDDALIAMGGPVAGSVGAAGVAVAGHVLDSQLLIALADFGFAINLFNLLPLGSMDGGRITGAMSPYANVIGLGLGGTMIYQGVITNPLVYLIMLGGVWSTVQRFWYPDSLPRNYYNITTSQRLILSGGYFGLMGALVAATILNDRRRKPPEVLERELQYGEVLWDMR